jgi:hypothetical protein
MAALAGGLNLFTMRNETKGETGHTAYAIVVAGRIEESWVSDLEESSLTYRGGGALGSETTLRASFVDQVDLRSVINRLFDLGCTLVSVHRNPDQGGGTR